MQSIFIGNIRNSFWPFFGQSTGRFLPLFLAIVTASLSINTAYSQTWERHTGPYFRHINDVQIISEQNVFFMGGNPENDAIYTAFKTPDLGTDWYVKFESFDEWPNAFRYNTPNSATSVGPLGHVRRSIDGGENWPFIPVSTTSELNDIFFADSANGFIVGGNLDSGDSTIVLATENGGQSWNVLFAESGNALQSVYFKNATDGFSVGEGGLILKTTDGGQNWLPVSSPVVRDFNAIEFFDSNNGLIVGGNFTNDSIRTILKTTDGGDTWNVVLDEPGGWIKDVGYMNADTAYAVGDWNSVFKTEDGGASWQQQTMVASYPQDSYTAIDFDNSELGVIVGRFGTVYFMLNFPLPEVETVQTEIGNTNTEAHLKGFVNTQGRQGLVEFEYDTLPDLSTSITIGSSGVNTTQLEPVQRLATALEPDKLYYYVASVTTLAGTVYGDTLSFLTSFPYVQLSMDSILGYVQQLPSFYGTAVGFLEDAELFFEYSLDETFNQQVVATPATITAGGSYVPSYTFSTPLPSGYYYVRLKAVTPSETYYSYHRNFFSGLPYSELSVVSADYDLFTDSVTLTGYIEGAVDSGSITFNYWNQFGSWQVPASPDSVFDGLGYTVTATIGDLDPDTDYTCRLRYQSPHASGNSPFLSFYTGLYYHSFAARTSLSVSFTSARINGEAFGFTEEVDLMIEYGVTEAFGDSIAPSPAHISDAGGYLPYAYVTDLTPNTTYYYRFRATTEEGYSVYTNTRQLYSGTPEIPNWNFESWDTNVVDLPIGWNIKNEDFEKVDLGGGNWALKIGGTNIASLGYWTDTINQHPEFHGIQEFEHRPDTVSISLAYSIAFGDTAQIVIRLDSAQETLSYQYFEVTGNSGGVYEDLNFPIEYQGSQTPDRISIGLLPSKPLVQSPSNYLTVDRVYVNQSIPSNPVFEVSNWESASYIKPHGWEYNMFLDNVSGNIEDPHLVSFETMNPFDTIVVLRSKLVGEHVIPGVMETGLNLFPVNGYHESLVIRFDFDKEGTTDTFKIELFLYENGELISESYGIRSDSTELFASLDIPIEYNDPEIVNSPDSGLIRLSILNSDNVSLSKVRIETLSFDGHYNQQDTIGYVPNPDGVNDGLMKAVIVYPNPTRDRVVLKNAPLDSHIELWGLNGQMISAKKVRSDHEIIEMTSLKQGVYFIKVIAGSIELTKKIILLKPN